jgi:D-3-phosphoglycerate dehydrogenase
VLQQVRLGDEDSVGHPRPGHHPAVTVHRQGLHRRRADVDTHGHRTGHGVNGGHDRLASLTSVSQTVIMEHMPAPRPKALVTAAVRGPGLDLLGELADLVLDSWLAQPKLRIYDAGQLAERVAAEGATVVVVESDQCGGTLFEQPLLAVASCRGDPNNVDVVAATEAGVPVLRAPGRNADAVAELAVGLLFAASRRVVAADRDVRAGDIYKDGTIPYQRFRAWELAGRTAGLVGLGAVGRALRWRLRGLGMEVLAYDPYAPDATSTLDELLARSDVVSVHAPVTDETVGMIGAAEFERMRDGVVFLNTARAKLHDTDALVAAVQSGKVGAAALDHFEGEWLDPAHPLALLDSVVLTPHIGGATYDTETNHTRTIAEDLCRLLAGARPVNIVNPEVLDRRT